MHRLTREVRFAVNPGPPDTASTRAYNGHAGHPPLLGFGHFFTLRVTLAGHLEPASQYLVNIKEIDSAVRRRIDLVSAAVNGGMPPAPLVLTLFRSLHDTWGSERPLDSVTLCLSPYLSFSAFSEELPMVRLSQKFEFSASHRLHNPALSDDQNRQTFGKCNNPLGHGHNYELQVTLAGTPDPSGVLVPIPTLERIVAETVIDRFDHKNLNVEVEEFKTTIPSVENIARVIYQLLKSPLKTPTSHLASVTVWETPKTWSEYSEE